MTTATAAPAPSATRWGALALIAAAQFMVIMDTSIIGVALPQIQADLGFTAAGLSWVFNAYVIALGGLLLLGGRLADLFGARRIFATGWVVLLVGSAFAGAAPVIWVELLGRAVQGAGSALIAPAALTLLMMIFGGKPKELTRAIALYGAAAPAGGTAGVFLGGVLTQFASWPWVFYINIPVAVIALAATPALMPAGGASRGSIDIAGALTVTAGLAVAVFAIVRAPEVGWASPATWLVLIAAAVLLGLFVVIQAGGREPLMRLGIFRAPNLGAANLAQLLLGASWIPLWFFLNLYLQQVLGYSAFPSGAALLPMTVLIMVLMIGVAPWLQARIGPKPMIIGGLLALGGGLLWLSFARPDGTYAVDVLGPTLLAALGQALAFIPSLGTAISSARPEEGGLASGIVNTSYQVGSALGLAAMTALAAGFGAEATGDVVALTNGFSAAFLGAMTVAGAGALLIAAVFRRRVPAPANDASTDTSAVAENRPEPTTPALAAADAQPRSETDTWGSAPGEPAGTAASGSNGASPAQPAPPARADTTMPIPASTPASTAPVGPGAAAPSGQATGAAGWQPLDDTVGGRPRFPAPAAPSPTPNTHRPTAAGASDDLGQRDVIPVPAASPAAADWVGAQVRGRVQRPGGAGVPAAITLIGSAGHQAGRTASDIDGNYALSVTEPGTYVLIAAAHGHQPVATTVTIGAQPIDAPITLTGSAEIIGQVTAAATAAPVPEATANLTDDNGDVVASARTDATGYYRLSTLAAGQHTLVISAAAFGPHAAMVTVGETGQQRHDAALVGNAHLAGVVRDRADGSPIPAALVTLLDQQGQVAATARTDAAGSYRFEGLDTGNYVLTATGYPPGTSPVTVAGDSDEADLTLAHPSSADHVPGQDPTPPATSGEPSGNGQPTGNHDDSVPDHLSKGM